MGRSLKVRAPYVCQINRNKKYVPFLLIFLQILVCHKPSVAQDQNEQLFAAVRSGYNEKVKVLILILS